MLKKMVVLITFLVLSYSSNAEKKALVVVRSGSERFTPSTVVQFERALNSELVEAGFNTVDRSLILEKFSEMFPNKKSISDAAGMAMAKTLNTQFLIVADLLSIGRQTRTFSGFDVKSVVEVTTIRTALSIYGTADSAALFSGNIVYNHMTDASENLKVDDSDLMGKLLGGAILKLGQAVKKNVKRFDNVAKAGVEWVTITVNSSIPNSDVSVDGIVVGSTGHKIKVPSGIHLMKVEKQWFSPWEKNVNIYDGQVLNVTLEMSDYGFSHYQKTELFAEKMAKLGQDRDLKKARQEVAMEVALETAKAQAQAIKDLAEGKKDQLKNMNIDIKTDLKELSIGTDRRDDVIIIKDKK